MPKQRARWEHQKRFTFVRTEPRGNLTLCQVCMQPVTSKDVDLLRGMGTGSLYLACHDCTAKYAMPQYAGDSEACQTCKIKNGCTSCSNSPYTLVNGAIVRK